jgi:WD40 repeat protein
LENAYAVAWNTSGTHLAVGYLGVWIYNSQFEPISYIDTENKAVRDIAWNPDDSMIALTLGGERFADRLHVVEVATQTVVFDLEPGSVVRWSQDGTQLAVVTQNHRAVEIYDVASWQSLVTIPVANTNIIAVAWSPDETQLAVSLSSRDVHIWNVANPAISFEVTEREEFVGSLVWSPAGNLLVGKTSSDDESLSLIRLWDSVTGVEVRTITERAYNIHQLEWLPGTMLLVGVTPTITDPTATIIIWDVTTGQVVNTATVAGLFEEFSVSPYGGRLAVANNVLRAPYLYPDAPLTAAATSALQSFGSNAVQIVVPAPSPELLEGIADRCATSAAPVLDVPQEADRLESFVAQVEALPADTLSPGCTADLLAVAAALEAE